MFEMLDEYNHEDGSKERFVARGKKHTRLYGSQKRYYFWWLVHNCIAHPLIGIAPINTFFRFHDYTSRKINLE